MGGGGSKQLKIAPPIVKNCFSGKGGGGPGNLGTPLATPLVSSAGGWETNLINPFPP